MKQLIAFTLCFALITSPAYALTTEDESTPEDVIQDETTIEEIPEESTDNPAEEVPEPPAGYTVYVNGTMMSLPSVIRDEVHFVPLRAVFERLGSFVFFRQRDRQIYALSRDGDTIQHVVGSNTVIINGNVKTFKTSSFSDNNSTYIPLEMISAIYPTSKTTFENDKMTVQMPFTYTEYNKAVNDVLLVCKNPSFHPERFKRYLSYHVKNPKSTMADVLFTVNIGLDYPFYNNVATIANPYDNLVLVNKYNRLPAGFQQQNLVKMERTYTINDGKQYLMTHEAYWRFKQLSDAARKEGISVKAASTYRTEDYQNRLYNRYLRTTGRKNADNYSARPGFSEHQTGLAVDINYTGTSFENTSAFRWLQNHAHEYGYILRYPKGKTWITGYAYEPWHYRYVGIPAATIIHNENITYEQYYAKYVGINEFK